MPDIATLSAEYQVSIPKRISEAQNWKPGQKFALFPQGHHVLLVPVPRVEDLRGIAKGATITNYRDRNDRY